MCGNNNLLFKKDLKQKRNFFVEGHNCHTEHKNIIKINAIFIFK